MLFEMLYIEYKCVSGTKYKSFSGSSKAVANHGLQADVSRKREMPWGEAKAGKYTGLKPPEDKLYDCFRGQARLAKH